MAYLGPSTNELISTVLMRTNENVLIGANDALIM
jgi:hypothetical protein